MSGYLALTLLCAVVGVFFALGTSEVIRMSLRSIRDHRGKKMLNLVQDFPLRFYTKIKDDVRAVTTMQAFSRGLSEHDAKVAEGKIQKWEKVVSYAKPTFTFAGSQSTLRPIHTGLEADLKVILKRIIKEITGIDEKDVTSLDYERAVEMLLVRDERLFVPYCGQVPNAEWQFKYYGDRDLANAETELACALVHAQKYAK